MTKGRAREIIATVAGGLLLLVVLMACKRNERTPAQKAADEAEEAKQIERANKALATLASLGDKVKKLGAPKSLSSHVLQGTRNGYANFDVLLADELSDPTEHPSVDIKLDHYYSDCAEHVKKKMVSPQDCTTQYVVVLVPRIFRTAEVSGNSYTPGDVDATAYVFDMKTGEMLGGGRVTATTPDSIITKSSSAQFDLNDQLGKSAFDSLADVLSVEKK